MSIRYSRAGLVKTFGAAIVQDPSSRLVLSLDDRWYMHARNLIYCRAFAELIKLEIKVVSRFSRMKQPRRDQSRFPTYAIRSSMETFVKGTT